MLCAVLLTLLPAPAPAISTAPVRAVHITAWTAGSPQARAAFIAKAKAAGLNGVVIALKEYDGRAFVRTRETEAYGAYANAIPDLAACANDFREAGFLVIGRVVLFKDDLLARKRPDWAVKREDGGVWTNAKGVAWTDPYRREVWDYNLAIASAAAAHVDEIQFDYVRFPSDGDTRQCRYSRADHSPQAAAENLAEFLRHASRRLHERLPLSAAIFGMTTTNYSGMGIGQHIHKMTKEIDFISPMMYPSHYGKGEYGLKDPNREPYKTIRRGLADATAKLGPESWRLRPYLQDFSLGVRYGPAQVRAQILAAAHAGVQSWILWNPQNKYTWSAVPSASEIARVAAASAAAAQAAPEAPSR